MTGTTTLETSGSLYFLAVSVVVCVVDSSWFWRFLWREYDILPYSWRKGHTPRRNWQKSLRIPNHPKNNSNIFIIQTYPKLSFWFSFKLAHKLVNNSMQIHPQTHIKMLYFLHNKFMQIILTLVASLWTKWQTYHCDEGHKQRDSYGSVFKMIISIQTIG